VGTVTRWLAAVVVAAMVGAAATRFVPAIDTVRVVGNVHHDPADVMRIARVAPGDPFLWTTRVRVSRLANDPWIASASVEKRWPNRVTIVVTERTPVAWNGDVGAPTAWALDGTALPGTTPGDLASLPVVEGWGPTRLVEALAIVDLLRERDVALVEWHPEGFTIHVGEIVVATPGIASLEASWAAVDGVEAGPASVYPWGASVANE